MDVSRGRIVRRDCINSMATVSSSFDSLGLVELGQSFQGLVGHHTLATGGRIPEAEIRCSSLIYVLYSRMLSDH